MLREIGLGDSGVKVFQLRATRWWSKLSIWEKMVNLDREGAVLKE